MKKKSLIILTIFILVVGGIFVRPNSAKAACAANPNAAPSVPMFSVNSVSGSANLTSYSVSYQPGCDDGLVLAASFNINVVGYGNNTNGVTNGCVQTCSLNASASGTLDITSLGTGAYTAKIVVTNIDGNSSSTTTTFSVTRPSYTVTPSASTGGSISPSTPQTVNSGSTTSFTVTPNSGYSIASVSGCSGLCGALRHQQIWPPRLSHVRARPRSRSVRIRTARFRCATGYGRRIAQLIFFETGPILGKDYADTGKYNPYKELKDLKK